MALRGTGLVRVKIDIDGTVLELSLIHISLVGFRMTCGQQMLASNDYLSRPFEFSFRYNVNVIFKILSVVFLSVMFYVPVLTTLT